MLGNIIVNRWEISAILQLTLSWRADDKARSLLAKVMIWLVTLFSHFNFLDANSFVLVGCLLKPETLPGRHIFSVLSVFHQRGLISGCACCEIHHFNTASPYQFNRIENHRFGISFNPFKLRPIKYTLTLPKPTATNCCFHYWLLFWLFCEFCLSNIKQKKKKQPKTKNNNNNKNSELKATSNVLICLVRNQINLQVHLVCTSSLVLCLSPYVQI